MWRLVSGTTNKPVGTLRSKLDQRPVLLDLNVPVTEEFEIQEVGPHADREEIEALRCDPLVVLPPIVQEVEAPSPKVHVDVCEEPPLDHGAVPLPVADSAVHHMFVWQRHLVEPLGNPGKPATLFWVSYPRGAVFRVWVARAPATRGRLTPPTQPGFLVATKHAGSRRDPGL